MEITVILCTCNRCESLANALGSLAVSMLPASVRWEVLVVDNNSRDRTHEIVEDFCRRYPGRFRYLLEPKQGKSHALNAGIRAAEGRVLVFTDDDVTVEPTWLANLTSSLLQGGWAGVAGRILPDRSFSPPRWFPDGRYLNGPLVMFDLGPDSGALTVSPFGANMAFLRETFTKCGNFRADLGPRPGSEIRCEDSEFCNRVLGAGERMRYEASAVVYHSVPDDRLKKRFFLAWWQAKARADIRASGNPEEMKWRIAGVPVVYLRRFLIWTLRWLVNIDPARRFNAKLSAWIVAGQIQESYRQDRTFGEFPRRQQEIVR